MKYGMHESVTITGKTPASSVILQEGNYTVRNLATKSDRDQAHRLRHSVFSTLLKWAPETADEQEIDDYDANAVFFGVFDRNDVLVCFMRLILAEDSFMLEKEFAALVGCTHMLRKNSDTAEASRLCMLPGARNRAMNDDHGRLTASMFLYKGVYWWCLNHNVRYLYFVVEHKTLRLLHYQGFPCTLIGESKIMPDGAAAVGAIMDWREFELQNRSKRFELVSWFTQHRSNPDQLQSQLHATGIPHRVSASRYQHGN